MGTPRKLMAHPPGNITFGGVMMPHLANSMATCQFNQHVSMCWWERKTQ
jgi:hypothetical protein